MRAFEFLIEYDRSKTVNGLGKKIYQAIDNDMSFNEKTDDPQHNIDLLFNKMEQIDPTNNKQFVRWIATQYKSGNTKYEDLYKLNDYLSTFAEYKPKLKNLGYPADINQYNVQSLYDLYNKLTNVDLNNNEFDTNFENKDSIQVLYHGPLGTLAIPETTEASCELGKGTQWCTAASKSDNRFEAYNENGKLYVWRDKNGDKFQFHLDTHDTEFTAMDKHDDEIEQPVMNKFLSHSVLAKLFKMFDKQYMAALKNAVDSSNNDDDEYDDEEVNDYVHVSLDYVRRVHPNGWPEIEPLLMEFDELFVEYVTEISRKPNEKVAKMVMRNPTKAVDYAKNILQQRWPEAESRIMNASNVLVPVEYASDVIGGRWPEAETVIKRSPMASAKYAQTVIKDRWPEAENIIKRDFKSIFAYATYVIDGRWPEAEQAMLDNIEKNPDNKDHFYCVRYAQKIVKGRWKDFEMALFKLYHDGANPARTMYQYAKEIIKDRWLEAEPIIKKDPTIAFGYANDVIGGRWKDAEKTIMSVPSLAKSYSDQYL